MGSRCRARCRARCTRSGRDVELAVGLDVLEIAEDAELVGLGVLASVELDVGLDVVADIELVGLDVVADVELVGLDVVADVELVGLDVGLVSRARCGVASLHGHCEVRQTVVWLARARCGSGCGRAHWRSCC